MTTVEKLLVQIFERKNSIIEQVKQQTELYGQHLASKLLIDGITPPSWLWNPNATESQELNKEELILKLLHPYPQPSAHWSFAHFPGYNNLVTTRDNEEFCDTVFEENLALDNGLNSKDDPRVPALSTDDHVGYTLNCASEPDASVSAPEDQTNQRILNREDRVSVNRKDDIQAPAIGIDDHVKCVLNFALEQVGSGTSPEDQTDQRILNIYNAPDRSLAGIQRSKSRQKALELRSGAKAQAKSGLRHESISNVVSSPISFSLFTTDQTGKKDELPQLAEPCGISSQNCEDGDLDEVDRISREIGMHADRTARSRSCKEVPITVKGCFTLGCSSENCKESALSHVDKSRISESNPSELAGNFVNKLPKSAVLSDFCCQSYGDSIVDDADFLSKDKEANAYTGQIIRSKSSSEWQSCGCGSSKDVSSNIYQGIDIAMLYSGDASPPECVQGSLVNINLSDVHNEHFGCPDSISEDLKRNEKNDAFPSWSSIQHNACVDGVSDLELTSLSAKVDGRILAKSSAVSERQINDSQVKSGLVKPSVGLFRRVTRSQTRSNEKETHQPDAYDENSSFRRTISKSDCKQKSSEEELQNTSSGQSARASYGTHSMLHDDNNHSLVMVNELVLHDDVDWSFSSESEYDIEQRRKLEAQVAPIPSDSFAFVEPQQLDCKEIEDYNLKAFTSNSIKRRLDNLPEKMSCSLSAPDVSLDKGICGGVLSLVNQLPGFLDVSSKGDIAHRDSFESDVQESLGTHAEKFEPVISDTILKASEDSTEAGLNCKISEVHHEADNMLSKMVVIASTQIQQEKLQVEHGHESLPVRHREEGDWSGEEKDKVQFMSSAPGSKKSRHSHCDSSAKESNTQFDCLSKRVEMANLTVLDEIKQNPEQQPQILSCLEGEVCTEHADPSLGDNALGIHSTVRLHGESLSLERRFRHVSMGSWPQLKRRKTEHQQVHSLTTSPSFRVKKFHNSQRSPASLYLKTRDINIDTAFMEHVNKSTGVGICPENSSLIRGIESTFSSQHGEVGSCYTEKNEHKNSSSGTNNEQLGGPFVSKESRNSQVCSTKEIRASHSSSDHFVARMSGDKQCSEHFCNLEKNIDGESSENLKLSNTLLEGIKSSEWEGGLQSHHSVLFPSNEDLQITDFHQSMPVFEGFIVNTQTDSPQLSFTADGNDFDELKLPRTTLERASILAEICRSASLEKPSSQFSSDFEFQGTQNLLESVPNCGDLENLDHGDTFPLNSNVGKHLQSGSSSLDGYKDALDGMPHSYSLACSGARYGWSIRDQHASPFGKLWDLLSSHSGSSEKRLNSNPELTCFPIEEDTSIGEENRTVDENACDVQEEIDSSLAHHCDKNQPLKDMTNLGSNMSVSAEEETLGADNVAFMSTKVSVTGTQEKVHLGPKYQYRKKHESSQKQTSSAGATDVRKSQLLYIGANGTKKAKESMNNSISKPIMSKKNSLKAQDKKLSLKESKRNNIVSNVSSFIPLIQQKQAATACAGKRDVKVKALEAAEAAKRLEEKKQNERKLRKDALKLERAKLGEKNLRNMELDKKRKEEERKKKDADNIAKKRQREEEERKEKEKKRMRLEERQRQRGQEQKKHAAKAEKENQSFKDNQKNSMKEFLHEPKEQQCMETTSRDGVALQKAETKLSLTKFVVNYEECGTSGPSSDVGKEIYTVDNSPRKEHLIAQNSQGKSYEISPYNCSDDEDEEDDELPTKKYIPSWASKSSVALLLPLQQELDPDVIFPPESFCSMDEVLIPRKLQQNQVVAA